MDTYLLNNNYFKDVWKDTKKMCSSVNPTDKTKTLKYRSAFNGMKCRIKYCKTDIDIHNKDTLVMAQELVQQGFNPLVLNMANAFSSGGGVKNGEMAQEEELFRRSDYHRFTPTQFYPLEELDVLYTPKVTVIKNENYKTLDTNKKFSVAMIACAAVRDPKITNYNTEDQYCEFINERDRKLMKYKIESIFQTAYRHGHNSIVLGALGCGCFNNPVYEIAKIFKEIILKYKFCFKNISFAILSKRDNNFNIFKDVFNN